MNQFDPKPTSTEVCPPRRWVDLKPRPTLPAATVRINVRYWKDHTGRHCVRSDDVPGLELRNSDAGELWKALPLAIKTLMMANQGVEVREVEVPAYCVHLRTWDWITLKLKIGRTAPHDWPAGDAS